MIVPLGSVIVLRNIVLTALVFLAGSVMFQAVSAHAATKTWTGTEDGYWSTADNWSPSGVPVDGDDIVLTCPVPGGVPGECSSWIDIDVTIGALTFQSNNGHIHATFADSPTVRTLVITGDVTSDIPRGTPQWHATASIMANVVLGGDNMNLSNNEITFHNVSVAQQIDLNDQILIISGSGPLLDNDNNGEEYGYDPGPWNFMHLEPIVGNGTLIIDITDEDTILLFGEGSTYTGDTIIRNGNVYGGVSFWWDGNKFIKDLDQVDTNNLQNNMDTLFGESDVWVEPGGGIALLLAEENNNGVLDSNITFDRGSGTEEQLTVVNVTDDDSLIEFSIPNITLLSDNQFDLFLSNGENVLIDLDGINNNDQYCVTYGEDNEFEDNFVNGPDCTPPAIPSCTLTSDVSAIDVGESVVLTWVITDATSATLTGPGIVGDQTVEPPSGGTITMTPPSDEQSVTYTLNATGDGGDCASSSVTVTINHPEPTCTLTTTTEAITAGESVDLEWEVIDATEATITGPDGTTTLTIPPEEDTVTLTPPSDEQTVTYTLAASGLGGDCESTQTITISQPDDSTTPVPTGIGDDPVPSGVDKTGSANRARMTTIAAGGVGIFLVVMKAGFWNSRRF